jgi:hypothetical protein
MKSDLIDITVEILHATEKAYLLSDGVRREWVPKSVCEVELKEGTIYVVTLPIKWATDKGFI